MLRTDSRFAKQRQDALLAAVESGSIDHIYELENEWPLELPAAKRAILAVFRHLDEMAPRLRPGGHHVTNPEKLAQDIALLRPCLGSFDGLLRLMDSESRKVGKAYCRQALSLVWEHLSSLITGLDFSARYSHIINADRTGANARHFGNVAGSLQIRRFYDLTLEYPDPEGNTAIDAMVDYIFKCWLRGVKDEPPPEDTTQNPAEYMMCPAPLFNSLWRVIDEDGPHEILLEKVRSLDDKSMKLLAESFGYRMVEWAKIHKPKTAAEAEQLDCGMLIALATASQELSVVPRLYRALTKARFATLALKVGSEFKECKFREDCGGSVLTGIARQFLPPRRHLAYELSHIVVELLEAGILRIIMEDMCTLEDKTFERWWRRNPYLHIADLAHHPNVAKALVPALADLRKSMEPYYEMVPGHTTDALTSVINKSHCGKLVAEAFENGDSEFVDYHLCDCLEHHHIQGSARASQLKECSWCQTVSYCSSECQKRDWDTVHKYTCRDDRVYRVDCQLNGAWLSYETRRRYLHWVKIFYQDYPGSIPRQGRNDELAVGRQIFDMDGSDLQGANKLTPYTPDEFMRTPLLAGLFSDRRSRAMVSELREGSQEDIYLMTTRFHYGQYFIALMSKFRFHKGPLRQDGKCAEPTVTLLNSYIHLKGPYGKDIR